MFMRLHSDDFKGDGSGNPICFSEQDMLAQVLVKNGALTRADANQALALLATQGANFADILVFNNYCDAETVARARASLWAVAFFKGDDLRLDHRILDQIGADICLKNRCLPMTDRKGRVTLVTACPEAFADFSHIIPPEIGPLTLAVGIESDILKAILAQRAMYLVNAATNALDATQSCRDFKIYDPAKTASVGIVAVLSAIALAPTLLFTFLFLLASFVLLMNTGFKLWVTAAFLRARKFGASIAPTCVPAPDDGKLPIVSILIPLFRETDIAERLLARMAKIRYPPALLDIIYLVEEADSATHAALARANLSQNMRILTVPDGPIRTKPRAMNFALPLCRGSIIGIYDAEDAPETDQILKIVAKFQISAPNVACLQARLDFYNTSRNWLARCFTVEYATWFRVILPGLQGLGMPIPLGGTSVFFRREVLEKVGAWDAHNVTEDADLGMRLAKNGYQTELVNSTTYEEANCRPWPWIKQRSRWLKGYGLTYIVMMRQPVSLIREVGFANFCGLQVLFLGTLAGFILAPVLLSFWLLTFGVPHPAASILPEWSLWVLLFLFIMAEIVTISVGLLAVKIRENSGRLGLWVPSMHFYFPMASIGAFKAIYEMATAPFYWDKTQHGKFHEDNSKT